MLSAKASTSMGKSAHSSIFRIISTSRGVAWISTLAASDRTVAMWKTEESEYEDEVRIECIHTVKRVDISPSTAINLNRVDKGVFL